MRLVPTTSDGEWEEDELLSLVMEQCFTKCRALNIDIAKGVNTAWYDKSLLYEGNLCQKVTDSVSLIDKYDELGGLDNFESWVSDAISVVVGANKYKGYIKE